MLLRCVYVCMFVVGGTQTFVCLHACAGVGVYKHLSVCMHVQVLGYMSICLLHACTGVVGVQDILSVCIHVQVLGYMSIFLFVCMSRSWGTRAFVCLHACTGLKLMSALILHCFSILFAETRSLSQTQRSVLLLVLLASLLWDCNYRKAATLTWHFHQFYGSEFWFSHLNDQHFNYRSTPQLKWKFKSFCPNQNYL